MTLLESVEYTFNIQKTHTGECQGFTNFDDWVNSFTMIELLEILSYQLGENEFTTTR
jgi:hypothetical protein